MKFGIISDIHLGPRAFWNGKKRTIHKTLRKDLRNAIKIFNKENLSFVINLGDIIAGKSSRKDSRNIKKGKRFLEKIKTPTYNVIGNHEIKNLSLDRVINLLRQKKPYYSFEKDNYHFIILYTPSNQNKSLSIDKEQLNWLRNNLSKTNKKTVIFSHYSLADQNLKGNPWFEGASEFCLVKNRKEVRKIIEKSKKVVAVINGHLHWNNQKIHKGVPYFTIQSLVENYKDKGRAAGAYAIVNLEKEEISVDIRGRYPQKFKQDI